MNGIEMVLTTNGMNRDWPILESFLRIFAVRIVFQQPARRLQALGRQWHPVSYGRANERTRSFVRRQTCPRTAATAAKPSGGKPAPGARGTMRQVKPLACRYQWRKQPGIKRALAAGLESVLSVRWHRRHAAASLPRTVGRRVGQPWEARPYASHTAAPKLDCLSC